MSEAEMQQQQSVFNILNTVNVNAYTEVKNKFTYLTWSKAWEEVKSRYPSATYEVVKDSQGLPYFGDDKKGYMCLTNVTIDGETLEMWLPVINYNNKAILTPNMMDINSTIMRCLTKNLAMFGLGLYIYAGEDLPTQDTDIENNKPKEVKEEYLSKADIEEIRKAIPSTPYSEKQWLSAWGYESLETIPKSIKEKTMRTLESTKN